MFLSKETGLVINEWIEQTLNLVRRLANVRREQRDQHHKERMILDIAKWERRPDTRPKGSPLLSPTEAVASAKKIYVQIGN